MTKIVSISEHVQHFPGRSGEELLGRFGGRDTLDLEAFLEADSERMRDEYPVRDSYERGSRWESEYCDGYYAMDFVHFGTLGCS